MILFEKWHINCCPKPREGVLALESALSFKCRTYYMIGNLEQGLYSKLDPNYFDLLASNSHHNPHQVERRIACHIHSDRADLFCLV